jgi:hypothetical protein
MPKKFYVGSEPTKDGERGRQWLFRFDAAGCDVVMEWPHDYGIKAVHFELDEATDMLEALKTAIGYARLAAEKRPKPKLAEGAPEV